MKDKRNKQECVYTPVKGSWSCKGCRYNFNPDDHDGCCTLPYEDWQRALNGIKMGEDANEQGN